MKKIKAALSKSFDGVTNFQRWLILLLLLLIIVLLVKPLKVCVVHDGGIKIEHEGYIEKEASYAPGRFKVK